MIKNCVLSLLKASVRDSSLTKKSYKPSKSD